ncbi:MAG TPA: 50S ribosomal protein L22 [Candidatus Paceibacterota bacterium]
MVTATLSNYRQAPRKVRLVANLIKGKTVPAALNMLMVTTKRASDPLVKLLESAVANAKDRGVAVEGLFVKEIRVNQGLVMRRMMPGARGTGFPIRKKTSHVHITLDTKAVKAPKAKKATK